MKEFALDDTGRIRLHAPLLAAQPLFAQLLETGLAQFLEGEGLRRLGLKILVLCPLPIA